MKTFFSSYFSFLLRRRHVRKINEVSSLLGNNFVTIKLRSSNYKQCSTILSSPFVNNDRHLNPPGLDVNNLPFQFIMPSTKHDTQRLYDGKYPSVTSVLNVTRPKNEFYALLNWQQGLIKDLGEHAFKEQSQKMKTEGSTFHLVIIC